MIKLIKRGVSSMRMILDRIEITQSGQKIAIFEKDEEFISISEENMPKGLINTLEVGDILEVEIVENKIIFAKVLKDETESKRSEMKSRLSNLFKRKK
jgi:hypothetical protein